MTADGRVLPDAAPRGDEDVLRELGVEIRPKGKQAKRGEGGKGPQIRQVVIQSVLLKRDRFLQHFLSLLFEIPSKAK